MRGCCSVYVYACVADCKLFLARAARMQFVYKDAEGAARWKRLKGIRYFGVVLRGVDFVKVIVKVY